MDKTHQVENKIAKKVKNEIRRTEHNIKALSSLSENSFCGYATSKNAQVTPEDESASLGQFESCGFESDQKNFDPEDSYADVQSDLHDTDIFQKCGDLKFCKKNLLRTYYKRSKFISITVIFRLIRFLDFQRNSDQVVVS